MTWETENWQTMIEAEMKKHQELWADVVGSTMTQEEAEIKFDAGYGGSEGAPFTLWTKRRVYFPIVYDGAEWVGSVPRNPCDEATKHLGGE